MILVFWFVKLPDLDDVQRSHLSRHSGIQQEAIRVGALHQVGHELGYLLRLIYLPRLKGAGVVIERSGLYRLGGDFEEHYERNLDLSGITRSEKWQRRHHAKERASYRVEQEKRRREKERAESGEYEEPEEEYSQVGVFLRTELRGSAGMDYDAMLERWRGKGGTEDELKRAIWGGPYRFKREGFMRIVYRAGKPSKPSEADEERIRAMVARGWGRKQARIQVLAPDHRIGCDCEVCG